MRVVPTLLAACLLAGLLHGTVVAEDASDPSVALLAEARVSKRRGEHDAAMAIAARAVEAATTLTSRRDALRFLLTLEIQHSRHHAARRNIPMLRDLDEKLGNPNGMAASDVQLASADASLGRLVSALARIEDAVAWFDANGVAWERRGAHLHAAKIRLALDDTVRAREHLEKVREAGAGLKLNEATPWLLEGLIALREGRTDDAVRAFRAVFDWLDGAAPAMRVKARLSLASALASGGAREEAKAELEQARAALGTDPPTELALEVETTAAFVHLEGGELEAAVAAGLRARAFSAKLGLWTPETHERTLARAYLALGDPASGLEASERVVAATLRDSGALPDMVGARYRAKRGEAFALGVEAAVRTGEVDRLFRMAELARAAALRARLRAEEVVDRSLSPALRDERLRLEEEEATAVGAYRALLAGGEPAAVARAYEGVIAVRERADRLRERIRTKQSLPGHLLAPVVVGLAEARADLAPDEALVVYAAGADRLHAVVATAAGARHVALAPLAEVETLVAGAVIEDRSTPAEPAVAALRRVLAEPLGLAPAVRRVRVVPVDAVGNVAFAAVWPDREIVRLPSVTVGRLLDARPRSGAERVLAAAGAPWGPDRPLDGAQAEVRAVGGDVLEGETATESRLRAAVEGTPWRAVHLACHALIDPVVPSRSALAFRPSPGSDGLWTLSEVLGAHVPADLVVLSACSTGTGRRFGPEGDFGFAQAFFVAGARRVIASLWDVDDRATTELMKRFYAEWKPGVTASAALQRAQAALRADARWAHPAYWAAWQVWGGA